MVEIIVNGSITLEINDESAQIWGDPKGNSIMLETIENFSYRNNLLNNM